MIPGFSPIRRAVNAPLFLGAVAMSHRRGEHDVGVGGMDNDSSNSPGLPEAHISPRFSSIGRFVDPVPNGNVAADERFAGSSPDDLGIGRCYCQRAYGLRGLVVEDGFPVDAPVVRLPNTAGSSSSIGNHRIPRHAGNRADPISLNTHESVFHLGIGLGIDVLGYTR